jgi:uncharacterized protein (DUF1501 family)
MARQAEFPTGRRDGPSRRDLLRVGALGLALPQLLRLRAARAAADRRPAADACILLFLWGSPSQFETFDPKPDAPAGVRGEFGVVQTRTPGVVFGEHVPFLAACSDRFAVVRTCTQSSTHHQSAAYEALTGYPPSRDAVNLTASPADHPNLGAVVARLAPGQNDLPRFVQLPELCHDVGNLTPGQMAGFLGRQFDPLVVEKDPNAADFNVEELTLRSGVSPERLDDRQALLKSIDRQARALEEAAEVRALDAYQDRAVRLLTSPAVKKAFDLTHEPAALRDRYGRHPLGQSCLLARRLVEAGVKLVTVCSAFGGKIPQDAWDTHDDNFRKLKTKLLPPFDQAASALIDDLHQRGLAGRTLLLVMGEFGRTPKVNAQAGRDHWSNCYSVLLAGGGVRPGLAYGASDRNGAYPAQGRTFTPADLCATVYDRLGVDPKAEVVDPAGKPVVVSRGDPMTELF